MLLLILIELALLLYIYLFSYECTYLRVVQGFKYLHQFLSIYYGSVLSSTRNRVHVSAYT